MPVTLEEIEAILTQDEINFSRHEDDSITISFATDTYRNPSGQKRSRLTVRLDKDRCCLQVFAANAFVSEGRYSDAIFRVLSGVQWRQPWVRFLHDESDGEIRVQVEIPMIKGPIESAHMKDAVGCLIATLEKTFPVFKRCYETGVVDFETEMPVADPVEVLQTLLAKCKNTPGTGAEAESAALTSAIDVLTAMKSTAH